MIDHKLIRVLATLVATVAIVAACNPGTGQLGTKPPASTAPEPSVAQGSPDTLGQSESGGMTEPWSYSEGVAQTIDAEVSALLAAGMQQAEQILSRHRPVLDRLAARLLADETIEGDDLEQIFQGGRRAECRFRVSRWPTNAAAAEHPGGAASAARQRR